LHLTALGDNTVALLETDGSADAARASYFARLSHRISDVDAHDDAPGGGVVHLGEAGASANKQSRGS
jgi:hypothetical protein